MNILDQLVRICHEIRMIEKEYKMPPHVNDGLLKASAVENKSQRENDLAATLYNTLKRYALKEMTSREYDDDRPC